VTSTPTRPVDNVVITTKGLQDRNIHIPDGTTVENKGKLILTVIYVLEIAINRKPKLSVHGFGRSYGIEGELYPLTWDYNHRDGHIS
jgi:hypothetical protein